MICVGIIKSHNRARNMMYVGRTIKNESIFTPTPVIASAPNIKHDQYLVNIFTLSLQ